MSLDVAKLSLRNQSALCLHHIDRVFLKQEELPPGRELHIADLQEAGANFLAMLDYVETARENGVVSLEELAFTDKIATPGGVYIDPVFGTGDPED